MINRIQGDDIQRFIADHKSENTYQLALKYAARGKEFLDNVLPQIRSWQKAKKKLPEISRIEGIVWPPPASLEQSSSERTAKFKASLLSGEVCADLTGGAGVDTFYLSKSFTEMFYIEKDAELCTIAAHNFQVLGANHIRVINQDAKSFIGRVKRHFSAFYIDPDRRSNGRKVYKPEDSRPDVIGMMPEMFRQADKILVKFSPWLDPGSVIKKIPELKNVYIVAVENECRELLCLVSGGKAGIRISAVNILKEGEIQQFGFGPEEEKDAISMYAFPKRYLYEPNAAILKAGAFKLAGQRYGLYKLHHHTHLYTSDQLVKEFPGRKFEFLRQIPFKKEAVKQALPMGKANLAVRNMGVTVARLKKRFGILDGGDDYLFAVTLQDRKPAFLHCRKVSD